MNDKYGILVNQDTKLHRARFKEMTKLLGINVIYKYPDKSKYYSTQGEVKANAYSEGQVVGCIFSEHEDQKTAKLLGWNAELSENAAIIHVPYDLEHIQIGCLFEVPAAIDGAKPRLFRVARMSTKMIYPASIACEIVPEYIDTTPQSEIEIFTNSDFNVLNEG